MRASSPGSRPTSARPGACSTLSPRASMPRTWRSARPPQRTDPGPSLSPSRPAETRPLYPRGPRSARHNDRRNRVGGMVEVLHCGSLEAARLRRRAPFDIVFANILLDPLKLLARPIVRVTRRDGRIVLSGLLDAQAGAALAA